MSVIYLVPPTFDVVDARAALEVYGLVELLRAARRTISSLHSTEAYLLDLHRGWRKRAERREIARGMDEAREEVRRRMRLLVDVAKACAEELA